MKNLYIDFDGVIMNTMEVTFKELENLKLDSHNAEHQDLIRGYYTNIDWHKLLNSKAEIVNDGINCIKKIMKSNIYNVAILTHVVTLDEAIEKVKFIRKYIKDITVIPVPREISKTQMVHVEGAILIDDYAKNLEEWESAGGKGIKFSTKLNGRGYTVIDKLDQILDLEL